MDPNISKIDGELLIDSTKQLNVLENKFNIVHDSHAVFSSTPNGKRTIAYVSASVTEPSKQELSLCSTHYHNKEKHVNMMKESALKGWHMPCDENELSFYSVTHEYGHMIQNILVENEMKLNGWDKENPRKFVDINKATKNARLKWYTKIEEKVSEDCKREILNIAKSNNPNFKYEENISKYGESSNFEFFAEVFANSQLSKPNELGNAMKIWLKRKGIIQ